MPEAVPVLCLPFAGAGPSFYFPWRRLGVEGIRIEPVQLPGRERLVDEAPFTDVPTAADGLLPQALRLAGGRPVAVFGHSLGAILAYELTRRLVASGAPVRHLFVSGSQGPRHGRTERATGLGDDDFIARVQEFAGYRHPAFDIPETRELLLPTLRADVEMHEAYRPVDGAMLDVPITSIRGVDDHLVSAEAAGKWREATSAGFVAVDVPGGHMYLDEDAKKVLELVRATLEPAGGEPVA